MSPRRWLAAVFPAVLTVALAACGSSNPLGGNPISGDLKTVVVGAADFPESKIIGEIYAQALEANDFTVRRQFGIGSRETYIPALRDHSIDLIENQGVPVRKLVPVDRIPDVDQVLERELLDILVIRPVEGVRVHHITLPYRFQMSRAIESGLTMGMV